MSGMNLFTWIRDGVRQSVLLGVSDAVEQLGTPADTDDLHPSVAGFLQMERNGDSSPRIANANNKGNSPSTGAKSRRRLGKSLKDTVGEGAAN
ncbi:hypothetical protein [Aureliella helgolandensis]|uniref:Uncharacterized protein n=1 Tax=Aureliella helgolandensis TaxID=2527968 RepID=A0A518GG68_9BACT|nr:hypothetical protein [Aureliella helgolandensis]QDV27595.1 hypothetical protein Q31a_59870 [Aureliella helgolandensis]